MSGTLWDMRPEHKTQPLSDIPRGCWMTYDPRFLEAGHADNLLACLLRCEDFRKEAPMVNGAPVEVDRMSCAFGDSGLVYRYAGMQRAANPWRADLHRVRDLLKEQTGRVYNFVLLNLYPNGNSGLGWHTDFEGDLEPGHPIATVSLGAERDFQFRLIDRSEDVQSVHLHSGSLLLMEGETQRFYRHAVPKRLRVMEPRISLTFRRVRTSW